MTSSATSVGIDLLGIELIIKESNYVMDVQALPNVCRLRAGRPIVRLPQTGEGNVTRIHNAIGKAKQGGEI
jgi:hypothetical protein